MCRPTNDMGSTKQHSGVSLASNTLRVKYKTACPSPFRQGLAVHYSRTQGKGSFKRLRAWVDGKLFLYNVTFGLYMLEWWEQILFNMVLLLLLWIALYNCSRMAVQWYERLAIHMANGSHSLLFTK
ncbi:hypothetical protein O6H91_07G047000 [Diphasiastrum complanatum]|uniref:Uncharacterized protein n=1 Tax=Diphasiastrum complanatum TaxID=34168 RepID=A0ACC2D4T0_DIPCM|nr:hypothetical protein O6H91_07G047000 [Diphasiastrum complanatum]